MHKLPDMNTDRLTTITATDPDQRAALASPLRLEILGLFTAGEPLAIADMAARMGRPAGTLYYHVDLLVTAGLLKQAGTRPKGKRWETLYYPAASRFELEAKKGGEDAELAKRAMASAFRMAERDLAAVLERGDGVDSGPGRNVHALRLHLRASPELLAGINRHLQAIEDLITAEASRSHEPSPDEQHVSLTLALLPLKGRSQAIPEGERDDRSDP